LDIRAAPHKLCGPRYAWLAEADEGRMSCPDNALTGQWLNLLSITHRMTVGQAK
jgi:hypothetical protein